MKIAELNSADFISTHADGRDKEQIFFMEETREKNELGERHEVIVNLLEVNKFRKISRKIIQINKQLEDNGLFIGCVQTHDQMRQKNFLYKIWVIGAIFRFFDFIFHRVFPKMLVLKNIYYFLTNGSNRRLTKTEVLGRLVCHGFKIIDVADNIGGKMYFAVEKTHEVSEPQKSSYGPLYRMPRIGKGGKEIRVFKFRTMHPYSEYLQAYILEQNGYASSGKPANDFRLTSWGKVLRKYWLDELPQLINVLIGDMKLIGVRPVSKVYFEDIPEHLRGLRLQEKPGCIPPYVALNKKGAKDDVLYAEEIYLRFIKKTKSNADASLIYLAMKNIFIKGMRSA